MAIHYRIYTGPGSWTQQFTGLLDLAPPTLLNLGTGQGGVFYRVDYGITGSFLIGTTTYTFAGLMRVQDQGAGLWDVTLVVPVSDPAGQQHQWESTTGAFFSADGSPYPSAQGSSSIAYSLYPEKIWFEGSTIHNPLLGVGVGTLVAERICPIKGLDHMHADVLNKKITDLSDALARLGKGTDLKELAMIIKKPGYTTPAEFAFTGAILDSMQAHATALREQSTQLLAASKLVAPDQQGVTK